MQGEKEEELEEMSIEEMQSLRICMNCNQFLSYPTGEPTEFGVCLEEEVFHPYVLEMLEGDYSSCLELIEERKFDGNRDVCQSYEPVEYYPINIDLDPEELKQLDLDGEGFLDYLMTHALEKSSLSIEELAERLADSDPGKRDELLTTIEGMANFGNDDASQVLFSHLQELPVVENIEDVHYKVRILKSLSNDDLEVLEVLLEELYKTPSNNTTRQWISAIFDYMMNSSLQEAEEALERIAKDTKSFSHRLRKKAKRIIDHKNMWEV